MQNLNDQSQLPSVITDYIDLVIKKMRYRKKVRLQVKQELTDHFTDALDKIQDPQQRTETAQQLIDTFGEPALLAKLIRRGKKRCRPLWLKLFFRSLQAIGILILLFILYSVWFFSGSPNPRIDYLEVMNQMNKPAADPDSNAWPLYKQAFDLYKEFDKDEFKTYAASQGINVSEEIHFDDVYDDLYLKGYKKLTPEQKLLLDWQLQRNFRAWQLYKKASQKRYLYREYGYGDDPNKYVGKDDLIDCSQNQPWLIDLLLPHLGDFKNLAKIGNAQALYNMQKGDLYTAAEDYLSITRTSKMLHINNGVLVEKLVGIAIGAMANEGLTALLENEEIPPELLKDISQQLNAIYETGYPQINVEGEKLFLLDAVQQFFTDSGPGGGHLVPESVPRGLPLISGRNASALVAIQFGAISLVHARRNETLRMIDKIYDGYLQSTKLSPYQKKIQNYKNPYESLILDDGPFTKYRFFLLDVLTPALDRVVEINFRAKCHIQTLKTIIAIKLYEQKTGKLPDSLDELKTKGYIEELPMDPYSPDPVIYKPRPNGKFLLYSVGPDFEDDGGIIDPENPLKQWQGDADTILYPPSIRKNAALKQKQQEQKEDVKAVIK